MEISLNMVLSLSEHDQWHFVFHFVLPIGDFVLE